MVALFSLSLSEFPASKVVAWRKRGKQSGRQNVCILLAVTLNYHEISLGSFSAFIPICVNPISLRLLVEASRHRAYFCPVSSAIGCTPLWSHNVGNS